jgi:hypothetical protein
MLIDWARAFHVHTISETIIGCALSQREQLFDNSGHNQTPQQRGLY